MSRKKPTQPRKQSVANASARWWDRKVLIASGLVALFSVVLSAWFVIEKRATPLPQIDFAGLDPGVAQTLKHHLEAVKRKPRSARTWGNLGLLLQTYDRLSPARFCLAQAERLDPRDPRWPYYQSLSLTVDSSEQSIAKLRRTVQLCGNEPQTPRLRLARLLAEAGQWAEARQEIQALLDADPSFAPALLLSSRHSLARGDLSAAISLAERCTEDSRTRRSATILMAVIYARLGDLSQADAANRKGAALAPDEPVEDPYQNEAAKLRNDPRILTEQTHPLLVAGRLQEAEPLVNQLLSQHPDYAETWLLAGRYQFLKKDLASATGSFCRYLKLDPKSYQGWFQLGLVQLAQERFMEAAESFQKATELKPDSAPSFYNRGLALGRAGNFREAAPAFRQAIRHAPERIDSYLMLADIQLRLAERNEAVKLLQQAEALNPSHPGLQQLREKAGR